jgi:cobalt/nickel transport system permease protein
MIPIWFIASRKVEKNLKTKQIPWLAFGVAFSFVIMMFNFPAPGGTTGHAVGAAILLLGVIVLMLRNTVVINGI